MWECELCGKELDDEIMAVEVKFGYVDSEEDKDQYDAFCVEEAIGPICDDCAIAYIKGEEIDPE